VCCTRVASPLASLTGRRARGRGRLRRDTHQDILHSQ